MPEKIALIEFHGGRCHLVADAGSVYDEARRIAAETGGSVAWTPDAAAAAEGADVLVTDYSSVMFDYSVTRRPMIFFVPDMDAYREALAQLA